MYTTNVAGDVREYNINEEDAYHIAIQVLQEMEFETFQNPECFKKQSGFSMLYNLLIHKVCGIAERIKEVKNEEFIAGCIHMMMDTCGIREYTIEDGADKLLRCRFVIDRRVNVECLKEKMIALKDVVEFVTDWRF